MRRPGSPDLGFSILTTSAPSQASASVQVGPASNWVRSTTFTPAKHCRGAKFPLMVSRSLVPQIRSEDDTAESVTTEIVDSRENLVVAIRKRDRRVPTTKRRAARNAAVLRTLPAVVGEGF